MSDSFLVKPISKKYLFFCAVFVLIFGYTINNDNNKYGNVERFSGRFSNDSFLHTPVLFMNLLCLMLKGISFNITVPIQLNYLYPPWSFRSRLIRGGTLPWLFKNLFKNSI